MKKMKSIFVLLMIAVLAVSACTPQAAEEPVAEDPVVEEAVEEGFKVAIILPGSIDDQSWNTGGYSAAMQLVDDLGVEVVYSERVGVANVETALRDYGEQGFDFIIGHSFNYGDAIKKVAPDYPESYFAWSQGYPPLPDNVAVYTAPLEQSAYLAGMIGGLMTESNKLGYIGGAETPPMVAALGGYMAGAKLVNPDVEVIYTFPGVWDDVEKGKESANAQFAAGVDFIMGRGDGLAEGVLEAAKAEGVWCIGDVIDQNSLAPELMVTSTIWDMAVVYSTMIHDIEAGTYGGNMYGLGMAEGATDAGPFHGLVPDDVAAVVNVVRDQIVAGAFTVPVFSTVPTAEELDAVDQPDLTAEAGGFDGLSLALILPGSVDDQSWNTGAYNALLAIAEMGVETTYTERVSIANLEAALRDYAEQGYDVIVAHSFNYGDAVKKVAEDYPETAFVWASGFPPLPDNVSAYGAPLQESAYLAGIIGGLMTESNKIGYIGGAETPPMVAALGGYMAGAKLVNPDLEIIYTFPGVWDDVEKGKESANAQFAAGVDFIMGRGDGLAEGVLEAAKDNEVWCVGDMVDQNPLAPELLVTSTFWDVSVVYAAILEDVAAGSFGGGMYVLGMADGATDVAPFHGLVSDDIVAIIDTVREQIRAGEFTVPYFSEIPTDEDLDAADKPVLE